MLGGISLNSQTIDVSFVQNGVLCIGRATDGGGFVLKAQGYPSCAFDFYLTELENGIFRMNVFNPRQYGFVPAIYYLYPDGSLTVVANNNSYYGNWSYHDDSNVSFKKKSTSCNIQSHHCSGFVPNKYDSNICDNCLKNGYKCHKVHHQGAH